MTRCPFDIDDASVVLGDVSLSTFFFLMGEKRIVGFWYYKLHRKAWWTERRPF